METDPCETAWASHLECDDAKVSRSSRARKSVAGGDAASRQKSGPSPNGMDLTPCILELIYALLAQLGERDTVTVEVRGSKPL